MLVQELMSFLADPNVAYLLFVMGLLGIVGEIITAGAVFPGVIGSVCLLLALVGFGQLPTNWAGAALIMLAIVLFLVDLKVPGHGLSMGGILVFALGSLLLFTPFWIAASETNQAYINPFVIAATTLGTGAFFLAGVAVGLRALKRPIAMGRETLLGKEGTVTEALSPGGIVHVEGEEWSAISASGRVIGAGCRVRVTGVEGLVLRVEPAELPVLEDALRM